MRAVPRLCGVYPGICLTTEENTRENLTLWIILMPSDTLLLQTRIAEIELVNK